MSLTTVSNVSAPTSVVVSSAPRICHNDTNNSTSISNTSSYEPKCNAKALPAYTVIDERCVWHWTDKLSEAEGWIVIDSPIPTASGGGLFLHNAATLEEVRDVATTMSAKLAVSSQPQIVGAKGGIRFPSCDPRAPAVLERFIRDNAAVISQYWGTGGDINTDHRVIDEHARTYCAPGTATALDALRKALGSETTASVDIHGLLNERICQSEWSVNEFSVGHVMAVTLRELLLRSAPDLIGQVRLILQGFGGVGATFAEAVKQLGIGEVVGISSQYGFIFDRDGIDCASIEMSRRRAIGSGSVRSFDPRSLEAGLSQSQLQSELYSPRRPDTSDEEHLTHFLSVCKGHVFVPCAQRYVVSSKIISTLINDTFAEAPSHARFILAGANNVFNSTERKDDILSMLDSASIRMLPEWISNSGTSNLFMRACSGLALEGYAASTLEACANDTKAFINAVFVKVGEKANNAAIWDACEGLANALRSAGAVNLLGVKGLTHLKLASSDVARASQTIMQLYGAKVSADGSCFQLPGPGDPTISVAKAAEGMGPAGMGFSVCFSVYNLAKARELLKAEAYTFHEENTEGQAELIIDSEEAGYPTILCQAPAQEPSHDNFSSSSEVLSSVVNSIQHLDHYATIQPDTTKIKLFHERMLGFKYVRTFTVNTGSRADGQDDGRMHLMSWPFDNKRIAFLTESLSDDSVFSKLLKRKCRSHVHHFAMKVDNVDAVFVEARARGWGTTSEELSVDLGTGLRQFFIKEEECGSVLEFIGDNKPQSSEGGSASAARYGEIMGDDAGEGKKFYSGNIANLANSCDV
ncbi:hypothetical protein IAQ61_001593 [Plenodomus lingam]|uniref:VOC domain-containing protein n=1 Tax=Leptosphaeria maculans (strain JN3 / isolate v23.1.3 / race Av1-4-5-6-7-8) TaxID=985895 RepID=E4ZFR3_LEPMJ|nr:hypothetical protein LEMA_P062590.1 [Plenodomus lingam JN3]KAH9878322.1 hypothetical protein IAQ61_001593 [Plenodomus lingam]CBX90133.1 hypothetical protein LEMA_P062590.1 [Plenodomus lingam JN3]